MADRSKLVSITIRNLGCIGPEGLTVQLDNIVCLVGQNNTGKSTVLRAYELAQSSKALGELERCQWTPEGDFPEVELSVHIPEGVENVDEKWKVMEGDLRIVRSRWQWPTSAKPVRQTWNPELNDGAGDWDPEEKAGGADNVFNSRLPQPLRIDALKDSVAEQDVLMKLIIDPIAKQLDILKNTQGSALKAALEAVADSTREPVEAYQRDINQISEQVGKGIAGVFPNLGVNIKVSINPPMLDAAKALIEGSSIRFIEGSADTALRQQGAGSRRAMFWSLLQVRSEIIRQQNLENERKKAEAGRKKNLDKLRASLEKERDKPKPKQDIIDGYLAEISSMGEEGNQDAGASSLPGYILLIDEPENCLHPMAVRAARNYLYGLAKDDDWQVMLSTHSPFFIDPLEDHTTIVRLERSGTSTTPRTFRTDTAQFSKDERLNLRALLQLDASLSEVFFGSYPILVEGDTELAAYIAAITEKGHPSSTQVAVVSARGKALLCPLIKLLAHFGVSFGILHDSDSPFAKNGHGSGAWSENAKIAKSLHDARESGLEVRHRVSIPDFERRFGLPEAEKDKPISIYRAVREDPSLQEAVVTLFNELVWSSDMQPTGELGSDASGEDVTSSIKHSVAKWAVRNATDDPRFSIPTDDNATVLETVFGA